MLTTRSAFVWVFMISGISAQDFDGLKIVQRTLNECSKVNDSYTCISDKAGRAIERTIDWDIPLIDGVTLVRNREKINHRQARKLGSDRLKQAIINFLDTHVISLKVREARKLGKKGDDEGFLNKKGLKKEQKYTSYAFMVLLGIFGLTGPLVMKILSIMAAKALLAAKTALIIVGSVALKKLFEKDRQEPVIKVHTVDQDHEDDYDRLSKYGYYGYSGSTPGQSFNNPYSSYYEDYHSNSASKNNAKSIADMNMPAGPSLRTDFLGYWPGPRDIRTPEPSPLLR